MVVRESVIIGTFFNKKREAGKLFFSHCGNYWNTRQPSFKRVLEIMAFETNIIKPHLLQVNKEHVYNEKQERERYKLKILDECVKKGNDLLNEWDYFNGKSEQGDIQAQNFYIKMSEGRKFVREIICPLLNKIERGKLEDTELKQLKQLKQVEQVNNDTVLHYLN